MPITKERNRAQYLCLDIRTCRDSGLSMEALGLLTRMLSRVPDWHFSVVELSRSFHTTPETIQKVLLELETLGYTRMLFTKDSFSPDTPKRSLMVYERPQKEAVAPPPKLARATEREEAYASMTVHLEDFPLDEEEAAAPCPQNDAPLPEPPPECPPSFEEPYPPYDEPPYSHDEVPPECPPYLEDAPASSITAGMPPAPDTWKKPPWKEAVQGWIGG